MNEAQLRGIDMAALRRESPSHASQIELRRAHEAKARAYWAMKNEPAKKKTRHEYQFTRAQLAIVEEIIARKKAAR